MSTNMRRPRGASSVPFREERTHRTTDTVVLIGFIIFLSIAFSWDRGFLHVLDSSAWALVAESVVVTAGSCKVPLYAVVFDVSA